MRENKSHRYTVSVTPATAGMLEEIAKLDGTSVSTVIRDCLRQALPPLLEVSRFLNDPHTTDAGALRLAADMEAMLLRIARGVEIVADGDGSTPDSASPRPRPVTRGPNTSQSPDNA